MEDDFGPASQMLVIDPNLTPHPSPMDGVPAQVDYFGFANTKRVMLPDGLSYVDLKVLNEGERRRYLNETNREVRIARGSGEASMRMRPGDEKAILLSVAIVGWNLTRAGSPVPFTKEGLDRFLQLTDPRVIDIIEKDVQAMNPWLLAEMSVDMIDKEIASLQEMRQAKLDEEAGKATS